MSDNADREYIEGLYGSYRIAELRRDPVQGKFDTAHLKEVHRRIFQDLPRFGFAEVKPGEYRDPPTEGRDWYKARKLKGLDAMSFVSYSRMDKKAQAQIDKTLADVDPKALGALKTDAFTQQLADLYTKLDHLHPFGDGNSRTLRAFTHQLAQGSGYQLDWERFSKSEAGRNVLYVARDLSVNRLSLPHINDDGIRRDVVLTLDCFEGSRDLPDLLRDAVRPLRAIAFEQLPEADARKKYPELGLSFDAMRKSVEYSMTKFPDSLKARQSFQENVRGAILERLNAGEGMDSK
ncbi:Fic family protein [Brucella sp. 22210]|uniref:Fic family protein n=1 Tax=Brucella sp. 22210 TaxID=3453892 RepID=UPI003F86DC51